MNSSKIPRYFKIGAGFFCGTCFPERLLNVRQARRLQAARLTIDGQRDSKTRNLESESCTIPKYRFHRKGRQRQTRMWVKTNFGKLAFLAFILNGICVASESRQNGNMGNIDLEKVRKAIIDPSTISNQITGQVLNDIFTTTGYVITGKHSIYLI